MILITKSVLKANLLIRQTYLIHIWDFNGITTPYMREPRSNHSRTGTL